MLNNFLTKGHLAVARLAQENPGTEIPGSGNPTEGPSTPGKVTVPSNLPGSEQNPIGLENVLTNVINWGLGIAGTVAVLMFVVGGFIYITSSGDEKRVERGKAIVRSSITGIIIILISAIIVNTLNYALFRNAGPGA